MHTGAWTADKEYNGASEAATSQHCSERKVLHIYRVGNGFIPLIPQRNRGATVGEWRPGLLVPKPHPRRLEERVGVHNSVDFKKNCFQMQILTPWRAWKTLDPQKKKAVCPHATSSHPVQGRHVTT